MVRWCDCGNDDLDGDEKCQLLLEHGRHGIEMNRLKGGSLEYGVIVHLWSCHLINLMILDFYITHI